VSDVTCNELIEFLDEYIAEELDAETRDDFEGHLAACTTCTAYLASYQETIELARGTAEQEEALAHDAPSQLIERIKHSK
jgi:anti-sigma factor RsiW